MRRARRGALRRASDRPRRHRRTGPASSSRTPRTRSARTRPTGRSATARTPTPACSRSIPVKTITTGEGGAVTTNSLELATRLRRFRSHGMVPRPSTAAGSTRSPSSRPNARITDMQCALGASQLTKLERFVHAPQRARACGTRSCSPTSTSRCAPDRARGLPARVPPLSRSASRSRRAVYEAMRAAGIGVQVHYVPIYRHPLFAPHRRRAVGLSRDRARVPTGCSRSRCTRASPTPRNAASSTRSPQRSRRALTPALRDTLIAGRIPPITDSLLYAFLRFSKVRNCCGPLIGGVKKWMTIRALAGSPFPP